MPAAGTVEFEIWSRGGWPRVDVVGEKFHEHEIRRLFPEGLRNGSEEFTGKAHLVPEPENPHDRLAVAVRVDGHLIGYLAKEQAARYSGLFSELVANGYIPTTSCRIWAHEYDEWQGTDRRGNDLYRSVLNAQASVVLDEPHLCVPANMPPRTSHKMLPHGGALQVKGEELHLDVLAPLVSAHGESWVYTTLHLVTAGAGKSAKQIVELRIDEQPIGQLTPAMSAHFSAAIEHFADAGQLVAAKTLLKGNPIQVEAILHAARGHELDSSWFAEPHAGERSAAPNDQGQATPPPALTAIAPRPVSSVPPVATPTPAPMTIPPKPTSIVFQAPPGWPPPPSGWEPADGWRPDPSWPPAPDGWPFWVAI